LIHFEIGNCSVLPPSTDNGRVAVMFSKNSLIANYSCDGNYVMEGILVMVTMLWKVIITLYAIAVENGQE